MPEPLKINYINRIAPMSPEFRIGTILNAGSKVLPPSTTIGVGLTTTLTSYMIPEAAVLTKWTIYIILGSAHTATDYYVFELKHETAGVLDSFNTKSWAGSTNYKILRNLNNIKVAEGDIITVIATKVAYAANFSCDTPNLFYKPM